MSSQNNPSKSNYRRCDIKDHWNKKYRIIENFVRIYQNFFIRKENKCDASSFNARDESHMTLKDDDKPRTSQKYDKDVEENLALR